MPTAERRIRYAASAPRADCHPDLPHLAHGLCQRCYHNRHRKTQPASYRVYSKRAHVKRSYALSLEQYEALLSRGCAICGSMKLLGIDHDHATGAIRGVLCRKCNTAIGQLYDSVELLCKALDYLEKSNALDS